MNEKENQITSSQLMSFIIATQIGTGVLLLPNGLAEKTGHDGWIAVGIYGLLITLAILIIVLLMKRYDNKNIYDINKLLYGKYIGEIFNIFIIFYLWFTACIYLRNFINIIKLIVLPLTPPFILSLFMITPTLYLSWYGLKFVARYTTLVYVAMVFCIIILFAVYGNFRGTFILPVGACGYKSIIEAFTECMQAFIGYELIAIIYPEISNKKKTIKYALSSNIITTLFYMILIIVVTLVLGENFLKKTIYPVINISRYYKAPIVERIDLFFIASWFYVIGMGFRAYFFATYYSINKLFNVKKNKFLLICFCLVTIFLSRIPKGDSDLHKYENIKVIGGTVFTMFMLICYVFSFINRKGVKINGQ